MNKNQFHLESKTTLLYWTSKQVYYNCINASINFTNNGYWYCYKFQGCRKQNGQRSYCYVCRVLETYCQQDFEKVKDNPINLIKLALAFFEAVHLCQDFNKTIDYFWVCDYEYTWRDIMMGKMGGWYLRLIIFSFYFV